MTSTLSKQGWRLRAACRLYADPDAFAVPMTESSLSYTRQICAWCPVRRECLDEGRREGDDFMLRAGLTPSQRRNLPHHVQDDMITTPAGFLNSGGLKQRTKDEVSDDE